MSRIYKMGQRIEQIERDLADLKSELAGLKSEMVTQDELAEFKIFVDDEIATPLNEIVSRIMVSDFDKLKDHLR